MIPALPKPADLRSAFRRRRLPAILKERALPAIERTGVLFVHVPKCGGKTVLRDLYGLAEHDGFGHAPLAAYEAVIGPKRLSQLYKFAFVREPLSRCRSGFAFAQRGGFGLDGDLMLQTRLAGLTFEEFVSTGTLEAVLDTVVFRPQHEFFDAKHPGSRLDRIASFEHFEPELRRVLERVGIERPVSKINQASSKPPPMDDPVIARRIEDIYARDYDVFAPIFRDGEAAMALDR